MSEIKKYINDSIKKVRENPGTIFGLLYPYLLTIVIAIGLYYISNLDNVAKQKVPPITADLVVTEDLTLIPAKSIPPLDVLKIKEPATDMLSKGKELYTTICASCHNETGAGGGPAAVGLNPAPRNLTSPDGWKNGMKLSEIYGTLDEGIEGSAMISYDFLTPEDRISIIHYIRSEFINDPPAITDDELTALDQTYNLSAGMELPAQIPVSSAMELILKESQPDVVKVDNLIEQFASSKNESSVNLFYSITSDKKLALSSLVNSNGWKNSQDNFILFITNNINQNGFNGSVFRLMDNEWNQLYTFLLGVI